ncbi:hypothetical protein BYT27DRAFT_7250477 [Phlegmacium glaucopus]|nr:hypothetical protein BYT27DRAFT_7250477 [Phlegmacium glaucopus]
MSMPKPYTSIHQKNTDNLWRIWLDEKIQEALDVVKGYAPAVKKPNYSKEKKPDA